MWRTRKINESSFRVSWKKPKPRVTARKRKPSRRRFGTKIALLVSLLLHLTALLTFRNIVLHYEGSSIYDVVNVSLLKASSVTEQPPTPRIPRRIAEPEIALRTLPIDASQKKLSRGKLTRRSIKTDLADESVFETSVPTISDSISKDRPLTDSSFSAGNSNTGASSQEYGKSDRSGTGRGGGRSVGGLVSVSVDRKPVDGGLMAEDLQIYPQAEIPFIKALEEIARHVAEVRKSRKADIVFIVDTSESMQDDIDAVRKHLNRMIDRFELAGLDFSLGVVRFHHSLVYEWLGVDITVLPQTSDVEKVKETLRSIKVSGGERALDALMKAIDKVKFRPGADRHFLLITDEYVSGTYPASDVLKAAKRAKIIIDVLGRDEVFQRTIAEQTGGIWTPIDKVIERPKP